MGHWAQNEYFTIAVSVLWPETLQKMSEVNWREEAPSWSCESEGSGEILYEEMVSDLLSGVLQTLQAL